MKDLQEVKTIAVQLYTLAAGLLRLVDTDETERARLIEDVKKTPAGKFYFSQAQGRLNNKTITLLQNRQYTLPKRR